MKIITVRKPAFTWNDKAYIVQTQKLPNDDVFEEMQKIYTQKEEEGYTRCFLFNITNSSNFDNRDYPEEDKKAPTIIRWTFIKSNPSENIVLGKTMKKIEKILRGDNSEKFSKLVEQFESNKDSV